MSPLQTCTRSPGISLLAADAWERFVSLEHGAGLVVVENDRPKVLRLATTN